MPELILPSEAIDRSKDYVPDSRSNGCKHETHFNDPDISVYEHSDVEGKRFLRVLDGSGNVQSAENVLFDDSAWLMVIAGLKQQIIQMRPRHPFLTCIDLIDELEKLESTNFSR